MEEGEKAGENGQGEEEGLEMKADSLDINGKWLQRAQMYHLQSLSWLVFNECAWVLNKIK